MPRKPPKRLQRNLGADLGRRLTAYGGPLHDAYVEILDGLREELGTKVLEAAVKLAVESQAGIELTPTRLVVHLGKATKKEKMQ